MPIEYLDKPKIRFDFDVYDGGKKCSHVSTNLYTIKYLLGKMTKGYSPIVGICGQQRDGKSYFGVWLAHTIMTAFGKEFNLNRNAVYDPIDAGKRIEQLSTEALLLDEAAYGYYKREWWDRQHTTFAKIIITQGRKVICYVFISPFIGDIDKAFVKHFDVIIDVKTRGLAKVFRYVKKYRSRKENENVEIHMDDIKLTENNLPTEVWETYKKYSDNEKDKIEKQLDLTSVRKGFSLKQMMRRV